MKLRNRFPAPSVSLLLLGFAVVVAACTVPAESDVPAADAVHHVVVRGRLGP